MKKLTILLIAFTLMAHAQVQPQAANPLSDGARLNYQIIKSFITRAAAKMPEENYSFKPTPEMQSFGDRIAHIAGQMGNCSSITGERKPNPAQGKTSKADIVAALKTSFEACDAAWASLNDKTAMETVAGRGGVQRTKLSVLIGNTTHNTELYGYICPYMRLKGVVPPTSAN